MARYSHLRTIQPAGVATARCQSSTQEAGNPLRRGAAVPQPREAAFRTTVDVRRETSGPEGEANRSRAPPDLDGSGCSPHLSEQHSARRRCGSSGQASLGADRTSSSGPLPSRQDPQDTPRRLTLPDTWRRRRAGVGRLGQERRAAQRPTARNVMCASRPLLVSTWRACGRDDGAHQGRAAEQAAGDRETCRPAPQGRGAAATSALGA